MKRAINCILNHKNPINIDKDGDVKSMVQNGVEFCISVMYRMDSVVRSEMSRCCVLTDRENSQEETFALHLNHDYKI